MPDFKYKVLDSAGKKIHGTIAAESEEVVLKKLSSHGYHIVDIKEFKNISLPEFLDFGKYFFHLSLDAFITFLRQFETLIKAGLPLFEALTILIEQETNKRFRQVLDDVRHSCAEGHTLADSFGRHPRVFSEFYVNMIMVGENSGDLAGSVRRVLKFAEEQREIINNIIGALIYPAVLVVASIVMVTLVLVIVLPQFVSIFQASQIPLPLPTRILLAVSFFLRKNYFYILLFFIGLFVWIRYYGRTFRGRRFFDELKISLPIFGPLNKKLVIARMTRVLGNLHESGVSLMKALEITQRTVGNMVVARTLDSVIATVREGKGIALPMKNSKLFPPMVVAMVAVGEESGFLEKMLHEVADYYEKETFYTIKKLISLIEPAMLILIGFGVGMMAISFLLPMFRMTALLRRR